MRGLVFIILMGCTSIRPYEGTWLLEPASDAFDDSCGLFRPDADLGEPQAVDLEFDDAFSVVTFEFDDEEEVDCGLHNNRVEFCELEIETGDPEPGFDILVTDAQIMFGEFVEASVLNLDVLHEVDCTGSDCDLLLPDANASWPCVVQTLHSAFYVGD